MRTESWRSTAPRSQTWFLSVRMAIVVPEVIAEMTSRGDDATVVDEVNEVRLVGRVSGAPQQRDLPSGDELWSFRVVVPRRPSDRSRQTVDALECVAWSARVRRSVSRWSDGDLVEVTGSVRRRFYRAGGGTVSRVEVEATRARVIRRAATA